MKTVMVIYEGAADLPAEAMDGRTPLQVARCPHADRLAASGRSGLIAPVREGLDGRAEVMLAALLGVPADEARDLQRGPVEAAGLERGAAGFAFAYHGNFVTLDGDWLRDCRVRNLRLEETRTLAKVLENAWKGRGMALEAVAPACVTVLCKLLEPEMPAGQPPCLIEGERADEYLREGRHNAFLRDVLMSSAEVLLKQTLNDVRLDLGENPANGLWLWGGGPITRPREILGERKLGGVMVTQSALARGMARLCGMEVIGLEEPGRLQKGQPAFRLAKIVEAMRDRDLLIFYAEAPKKLGLYGSTVEKIRALEALDQHVLGPLLELLEAQAPWRIVLAADSVVSTKSERPTSGNIPLVLAGEGVAADGAMHWDEESGARGSLGTVKAARVMKLLMEGA